MLQVVCLATAACIPPLLDQEATHSQTDMQAVYAAIVLVQHVLRGCTGERIAAAAGLSRTADEDYLAKAGSRSPLWVTQRLIARYRVIQGVRTSGVLRARNTLQARSTPGARTQRVADSTPAGNQ